MAGEAAPLVVVHFVVHFFDSAEGHAIPQVRVDDKVDDDESESGTVLDDSGQLPVGRRGAGALQMSAGVMRPWRVQLRQLCDASKPPMCSGALC